MEKRSPIPHGLVVMAETAVPLDAEEYLNEDDIGLSNEEKEQIQSFCDMRRAKRRIQGQTDDHLRSAGLYSGKAPKGWSRAGWATATRRP